MGYFDVKFDPDTFVISYETIQQRPPEFAKKTLQNIQKIFDCHLNELDVLEKKDYNVLIDKVRLISDNALKKENSICSFFNWLFGITTYFDEIRSLRDSLLTTKINIDTDESEKTPADPVDDFPCSIPLEKASYDRLAGAIVLGNIDQFEALALQISETQPHSFWHCDAEKNTTLLHLAIEHVQIEILEILLCNDYLKHTQCLVNKNVNMGKTPLHLAAEKGEREAIELLISHGADMNANDENYKRPYDVANDIGIKNWLSNLMQKYRVNEIKYSKNPAALFDFFEANMTVNLRPPLIRSIPLRWSTDELCRKVLSSESWNVKSKTCVTALYGPKDIGKSEFVFEFAADYNCYFSLICYIDCSTSETQQRSYDALSKALNIPLTSSSMEEIQKTIFTHLELHKFKKPWLLIFDHVKDMPSIPAYGGSVLIVSNEKMKCCNSMELEPWGIPEAATNLRVRSKMEFKASQELAEAFNCHPLALLIAITYLRQTKMRNEDYLSEIRKYPDREMGSYKMSLAYLKEKYPLAFEWLKICESNFTDKTIENWLLSKKKIAFKARRRSVIEPLKKLGFIRYDSNTESYELHSVIKNLIKELIDKSQAFEKVTEKVFPQDLQKTIVHFLDRVTLESKTI